jgi:hypothetical protein
VEVNKLGFKRQKVSGELRKVGNEILRDNTEMKCKKGV